ncbi:MAG: serine/threonine protein kinase, partial [Planctomycetota bacterium]
GGGVGGGVGSGGGTRSRQPTPVAGLPPGTTSQLGKYRILKMIGQGGMGSVYLAEDTHLNRKVALKVLPKELAANRDFIKRFLAEARVTGKLNHPNIVVAYDIDSSQGTWYMAMEYLDGESIGKRLLRGEAIPWREALTMLKQICRGLAYAHKNGIVHRDIKPDNLFLDRSSNEAKILDMGLSKNLHASEVSSLTQAGMILGTPNYLAPEQAENGLNVDRRADIYSLGATLYHMLTGAAPFDAPTPLALIQKHLFEPMPDVRRGKPEIPADVANLVWKMTAKRPADRFQDCTAVVAAADDILEGRGFQPADPMGAAAGRRVGSGVRRATPGAGSGFRTAVSRTGTRGFAAVDRKSRQLQAQRRSGAWLVLALMGLLAVGVVVAVWLAVAHAAANPHSTGARPGASLAAGESAGPAPNPASSTNPPSQADAGGTTSPTGSPVQPAQPLPVESPADLDAVTDLVNVASRGLNVSAEVDRTLADAQSRAWMQQALEQSREAAEHKPSDLDGSSDRPPTGDGLAALAPGEGAPNLFHSLTAAECKNARHCLDAYRGDAVFRMAVPHITDPTILAGNIRDTTSPELGGLPVLTIGQPPKLTGPAAYNAIFVQIDGPVHGLITSHSRVRMIVKVTTGDAKPLLVRLVYSDLPIQGATVMGGLSANAPTHDWLLIDVPLQLYKVKQGGEGKWFGYAIGTAEDFTHGRNLNFSVSDIIIYNPKP